MRPATPFILAALVLLAACGGGAASPRKAGDDNATESAAINRTTLERAVNFLVTQQVAKPRSDKLLDAAWDGYLAEAGSEGVHADSFSRPHFTGVPATDVPAFAAASDRFSAGHRTRLDGTKLTYAAIDRMAQSLDDSHTALLRPDQAELHNKRDAGNLGTTTGLRLERVTGRQPIVLEVVPGSAAEQAGIRPGDTIIEFNGRNVLSLMPRELGRGLEGPDGTTLTLRLRHAGSARSQPVTIIRRTMALDLVRSAILPGNIGYIRIREFPGAVPIQLQVKQALGDFAAAQAAGVIVDLRGNPGGSLDVLRTVMSQFITQNPFSFLVGREGLRRPVGPAGSFLLGDRRLVVLVDDGSASSSELFASAVQEYHDGLIVGTKSCGCLMAAQFFRLDAQNAQLEIALEGVLSPVNQRPVEKAGVQPDIEVPPDSRALGQGRDPQLEAGLVALGVDAATARTANQALLKGSP